QDLNPQKGRHTLSVITPSYNEIATLERCVAGVMSIANANLALEIRSIAIAESLAARHTGIRVCDMQKIWAKGRPSGAEFLKRRAMSSGSKTHCARSRTGLLQAMRASLLASAMARTL